MRLPPSPRGNVSLPWCVAALPLLLTVTVLQLSSLVGFFPATPVSEQLRAPKPPTQWRTAALPCSQTRNSVAVSADGTASAVRVMVSARVDASLSLKMNHKMQITQKHDEYKNSSTKKREYSSNPNKSHHHNKTQRQRESSRTQSQPKKVAKPFPPTAPKPSPVPLVLLRAIGNALPPRHSANQTLDNLDFILAHEKRFPHTTRHWFLNRIVDPKVEQQLIQRLVHANETYTVVPFDDHVYRQIYALSRRRMGHNKTNARSLSFSKKKVADDQSMHDKILYVINVNGVRNAMIEYGRQHTRAEYILPWDGNCFVTRKAWSAIQRTIRIHPNSKYFVTPMYRLKEPNHVLLTNSHRPNATEEPQIIFHRSAQARFNEQLRYGRYNKVELLSRIGVRGRWDTWKWLPSEKALLDPNPAPDAAEGVPVAGWTTRLYSGIRAAEGTGTLLHRGNLRQQALAALLDRLDARVVQHRRKAVGHASIGAVQ